MLFTTANVIVFIAGLSIAIIGGRIYNYYFGDVNLIEQERKCETDAAWNKRLNG